MFVKKIGIPERIKENVAIKLIEFLSYEQWEEQECLNFEAFTAQYDLKLLLGYRLGNSKALKTYCGGNGDFKVTNPHELVCLLYMRNAPLSVIITFFKLGFIKDKDDTESESDNGLTNINTIYLDWKKEANNGSLGLYNFYCEHCCHSKRDQIVFYDLFLKALSEEQDSEKRDELIQSFLLCIDNLSKIDINFYQNVFDSLQGNAKDLENGNYSYYFISDLSSKLNRDQEIIFSFLRYYCEKNGLSYLASLSFLKMMGDNTFVAMRTTNIYSYQICHVL
ncbi:MAG: hypothetical protein K0R73_227 [Candidatus Midichloriaceae bacterium]|jgi:hypothetical protein|nr:hypothetical protein [Candidatus Midichloriaceae bacterium]